MKYILTFIGGVTVGLLTAMGIYAAEENDQKGWWHSIDGGEDTILQEEIQTDEGVYTHDEDIDEAHRSVLFREF